jgi:uncharacterized membrane protein YdjX (TVP38/TMEM64 family)
MLSTVLLAGALLTIWWTRTTIVDFIVWISDRQGVIDVIAGYGGWAPLVYIMLVLMQIIVALIPGHALVLAGAYVFGFVPTLLLSIPTAIFGSQLAFYVARRYGLPAARRMASRRVIDRWESVSAGKGMAFYFLCFLLPVFPADAMCYVAGLGTISSKRFFMANTLGRSVSTVFMTLVGAYGQMLPSLLLGAAGFAVIGFYLGWFHYLRRPAPAAAVTHDGENGSQGHLHG